MQHQLVEPAIIQDIYATGRLVPEDLGNGDFRFTFYVKQRSTNGSGDEYVIVARIVMPAVSVIAGIPTFMKALGVSCCGAERMKARH